MSWDGAWETLQAVSRGMSTAVQVWDLTLRLVRLWCLGSFVVFLPWVRDFMIPSF